MKESRKCAWFPLLLCPLSSTRAERPALNTWAVRADEGEGEGEDDEDAEEDATKKLGKISAAKLKRINFDGAEGAGRFLKTQYGFFSGVKKGRSISSGDFSGVSLGRLQFVGGMFAAPATAKAKAKPKAKGGGGGGRGGGKAAAGRGAGKGKAKKEKEAVAPSRTSPFTSPYKASSSKK